MTRAILLALVLLCPVSADAAITRAQYKYGGTGSSSATTVATGNFAGSVTSGNLIVVFVRAANGIPTGVTDTLGNTYTNHDDDTGVDPNMSVWSAVSTSSGTNSVTGTWSGTGNYRFVVAVEYAPGANVWSATAGTRLDVAGSRQGASGSTDLTTSAFSTAQAESVVVVTASQPSLNGYSAGTDFTLIEGSLGNGAGSNYGAIEEYITGGTLSSYTAHINGSSSASYVIQWAVFRTSTPSGSTPRMMLLGVGQ